MTAGTHEDRAAHSPYSVYRSHLDRGELAYQWSPTAQRAIFFPRLVCPYSGSTLLEWRIASGGGSVYSSTTVFPRGGTPYNISLVDCDEGFRLMTRIVGVEPERVAIGARVHLTPGVVKEGGEIWPLFSMDEAT